VSTTLTLTAAPTRIYAGSEDPSLFQRARTWWLLLALFLMAQGNGLFTRQDRTYFTIPAKEQELEGTYILLLLTALLWLISAGLMVKGIGPTLRMMLKQKAVLAFVVLAYLSTLWSQDPQMTFRKATLLFLACAFAWFFASYYSPTDQMRLLLAAGVIVALASIAMALLLPQYGIAWGGEWKGVFGQKNRLGLCIFYLFSGLPFCRIPSGRRLLTLVVQAVLPVGLILLSQSKTSLILTLVVIVVRIFGPYIARRRKDQLPFVLYSAVFGIPLIALAISASKDIVLNLLGRESTLTGRTDNWTLIATYAFRHLWIGYGYNAFWTGTGDSLQLMKTLRAAMIGSDSGYLDTMLQFGLVGLSLLLLILLISVRDFARIFRTASVPLIAYWYFGISLATFIGSFTEALFLPPIGITTFIFVLACAGLRRLSYENAPSYHGFIVRLSDPGARALSIDGAR
jgi:exopolysaccharide production protein ExoQ